MAGLTIAAPVVLTVPVFSMNLGINAGAKALPDALEGKRALELLEQHFSSSLIVPAKVVIDAPDVSATDIQSAIGDLLQTIENDDAFLGPFGTVTNAQGNLLRVNVPLAGNNRRHGVGRCNQVAPRQDSAGGICRHERPGLRGWRHGGKHRFQGPDVQLRILRVCFVLGLSFLLLLIMFRSIIIPLKALVLNLLSVGAVYGVLVIVFQWGWGISILGSEATGIIETWLPLFLFGILFGLSMDYHMLLLNRIKEEYDKHGDNEQAVATGIRLTAGQITSAAAVMVGYLPPLPPAVYWGCSNLAWVWRSPFSSMPPLSA